MQYIYHTRTRGSSSPSQTATTSALASGSIHVPSTGALAPYQRTCGNTYPSSHFSQISLGPLYICVCAPPAGFGKVSGCPINSLSLSVLHPPNRHQYGPRAAGTTQQKRFRVKITLCVWRAHNQAIGKGRGEKQEKKNQAEAGSIAHTLGSLSTS